MPLDDLQKLVVSVLMPLRSPDSVFAGGSLLQKDAFRLSEDHDIFHPSGTNVVAIARRDLIALRNAGFTVDASTPYPGLVEAKIGMPEQGFTLVQWVESGSWNFFSPVPDREFGWRLHMADLSVNKALAAGGRRQIRDYVDLMLVHEHIMPLWHAIWASPGKDEGWSPLSLAEKIAASNGFKQSEVDNSIASIIPISASELSKTIKAAVEECREVFPNLPGHLAGRLFVDANGGLINDWKMIAADPGSITTLEVREGGTWPSGPSIDAILIERVASAYAASRPKYSSFDLGMG